MRGRKWQMIPAIFLILVLLAACGKAPATESTAPETQPAQTVPPTAEIPPETGTNPAASTEADPAETSTPLPTESTAAPPASSEVPPETAPPASSEAPPETAPPATETPLLEDIIDNPDGSKLIRRYDPEGRPIEEVRIAANGTQLSSKKIVYYPGGTTVKWLFEESRKEDGSFLTSSESGYYENGMIKSFEERAADGSSSLTQYDENGRETLRQKKNKEGISVSTVTQTYFADGACASRITEKRDEQGGLKDRTAEAFYADGVLQSVEKLLTDGRRHITNYNEKGVRTRYEEYDAASVLRVRNSWEYFDDGKVSRTVEEAWKADGSLRSRTDTKYSIYDALSERRSIREDQPDREIYESFDDSNRLIYIEENWLGGGFIHSCETVYFVHSDQIETTEEIWMEGGAPHVMKRTYAWDGTLQELFEKKTDGSTITDKMDYNGRVYERVFEDAGGKLTEKLTWEYYEGGETHVLESYCWDEDAQAYETYREEYTENGDTYLEGSQSADGSTVIRRYDQPGRLAQYEEYFPNGSLQYGLYYEFFENSDECSRFFVIEGDENGTTLSYSEVEYYRDGSVRKSYEAYGSSVSQREYNQAGNLLLYSYTQNDVLLRKEQYSYKSTDPDMLAEEDIQVWNEDGSMDFHETNEYSYPNGGKSSHRYIYSDGSWEFKKYDGNGRLILERDVLPNNIVEMEREIDPESGYERIRRNYPDGYLKSDFIWVKQQLRSRTLYYENHGVRIKETVNEDGTGEIREYSEAGWLVWKQTTTKDWIVERSYSDGRLTFRRYTDRSGNFMTQTTLTYFTQGGEKMIRIDVMHSDYSTESKTVKDDGKIGYDDP